VGRKGALPPPIERSIHPGRGGGASALHAPTTTIILQRLV